MHGDCQIIIPEVMRHLTWAVVVLACAAGRARAADATDRVTRTIAMTPGRGVRVEATVADVTITGSNRSDVAVEIIRHAPTSADLSRYPAVIEDTPDGIRIGALQQDDGRDARLKTEIVVRAPAAAAFQAVRVFEGRVRVSGLTHACDVDIRRGPIEATGLAGRVRLEAGLGSVDVRSSALTPGGMMRLRVFNGPLRVRFARAPESARILALTFNGAITSDIPLTAGERFGPRFGETTIGSGDPVMSLDVVTGDISITVEKR
jgi:hypothetical protein